GCSQPLYARGRVSRRPLSARLGPSLPQLFAVNHGDAVSRARRGVGGGAGREIRWPKTRLRAGTGDGRRDPGTHRRPRARLPGAVRGEVRQPDAHPGRLQDRRRGTVSSRRGRDHHRRVTAQGHPRRRGRRCDLYGRRLHHRPAGVAARAALALKSRVPHLHPGGVPALQSRCPAGGSV
ncbi:MAG: Orotate phosphoribosyltransferase, partial [uncultured Truepera sp.]